MLIFIEIVLITQRKLLPGVMIIGSFILVVLYITGIIETGIQLYGDPSDVNGKCQRYVDNNEQFGPSVNTLAWLEQDSICKSWSLRRYLENEVLIVLSSQARNGKQRSPSGSSAPRSSYG